MLYPTTTEEFESKYGSLDSQPVGSYIVGWSYSEEADAIEDAEIDAQIELPEDIYGDEYDGIVTGEEE